jgi:hypothetical protein
VVCCQEVPYCGDGVCFYHEIPGYGENETNCPRDCGETPVQERCVDSDGGKNYYTFGEVRIYHTNGGVTGFEDVCAKNSNPTIRDPNALIEAICPELSETGDSASFVYSCPYGCENGKCIERGEREQRERCDLVPFQDIDRDGCHAGTDSDCGGIEGVDDPGRTCYDGIDNDCDGMIDARDNDLSCNLNCGDGVCGWYERLDNYDYYCPRDCEVREEGVYKISIKGQLINQLTGEPVKGARLFSSAEFSPSEVVTDDNGYFRFTISSDFRMKEGPEAGMTSRLAAWSFHRECYDYANIVLHKDYGDEHYEMALITQMFDAEPKVKDVSGKTGIDVGQLQVYPNADISINTDKEYRFTVQYKYKNLQGYNGAGNINYRNEHYLTTALPLDYEVHILFEDEQGNKYKSDTYNVPEDAHCSVIALRYGNGESKWAIVKRAEPSEETGPIAIPIEDIKEGDLPSTICSGCLFENKCYPFNYRRSGEYCSIESNRFEGQLEAGSFCNNNFECSSNVCVDGECISGGLLRRILEWFRKLF